MMKGKVGHCTYSHHCASSFLLGPSSLLGRTQSALLAHSPSKTASELGYICPAWFGGQGTGQHWRQIALHIYYWRAWWMSCQCRRCRYSFSILRELFSSSELPRSVCLLFTFRLDKGIVSSFSNLPASSLSTTDLRYPYLCQITTCWDWLNIWLTMLPRRRRRCSNVQLSSWIEECTRAEVDVGTTWSSSESEGHTRPGPLCDLPRHSEDTLWWEECRAHAALSSRHVMDLACVVASTPQAFAAVLLPADEQSDMDGILDWLGSLLSGTMPEDNATHFPTPHIPTRLSARHYWNIFHKSFRPPALAGGECINAWAYLRIMNTGLESNICKLPTSFALNSQIEAYWA